MARTRTTKTVAQRIDLNYFKRPTPFKRAKLWLSILAPALALVWLGFHAFAGDRRVYSSGRLGEAHALLETQCATCHLEQAGNFSAIAADSACLACHDGPPHHPSSLDSKLHCAECHSEHRGKVSLVATRNQSCATCHASLAPGNGLSTYAQHIRTFEDGHPEFAALRALAGSPAQDSATIRLNHALHMRAIRRGPNGPMVQLDCGSCHNPEATDPDLTYSDPQYRDAQVSYKDSDVVRQLDHSRLRPPRPLSGRERMAPPKFANACAGCHLLTFDKKFEEGVPHDKPEAIHAYLVRKFSEYVAAQPGETHEVQDPQRNLAGRASGAARRSLSPAEWVAERVAVSEQLLWHKTCAQCHGISSTPLQDVKIARWDAASSHPMPSAASGSRENLLTAPATGLPVIAPANLTLQWLPHSRFDHDAHRGFSCIGCHQNALTSKETADILVPGIAVCQTCHAPAPGHAESRCFECHTFHDWGKRKEVKPSFTLPALQTGGR